ncbi:MAG: transposase [Bdellovibrionales bacterium]|nr:transposase [Bdellovibrionales bacterium]
MPRKKLIYTPGYPYHVIARSNNKENFHLPKDVMWRIFIQQLNQVVEKYKSMIHAFVLMDNHYHLLITTHEKYDLGVVMQYLQRSVSRIVNSKSRRINHVFGGAYKASIIYYPHYYYNVYKYIYQNPLRAGLVSRVEEYNFSTLVTDKIPISCPTNGIACYIPKYDNYFEWMNDRFEEHQEVVIQKGLNKVAFEIL